MIRDPNNVIGTYCFLIYSSMPEPDGLNGYSFGFGTSFFRLIGDRPFGRGDVAQIVDIDQWHSHELRINVRILGDPRVRGRYFDERERVELPTLLFLSSRIYLSSFSDYQIDSTINANVISFQSVQQDQNKIYAVACLCFGTEAKIICVDHRSKVKWEFLVTDKPEERAA